MSVLGPPRLGIIPSHDECRAYGAQDLDGHITQPFRDWADVWPAGPPALSFSSITDFSLTRASTSDFVEDIRGSKGSPRPSRLKILN